MVTGWRGWKPAIPYQGNKGRAIGPPPTTRKYRLTRRRCAQQAIHGQSRRDGYRGIGVTNVFIEIWCIQRLFKVLFDERTSTKPAHALFKLVYAVQILKERIARAPPQISISGTLQTVARFGLYWTARSCKSNLSVERGRRTPHPVFFEKNTRRQQ